MPEGHTLFRLARTLDEHFGGRVVSATSPQGRFAESAGLIDGTLLEAAESYGKHLFMDFEQDRRVHVHLGPAADKRDLCFGDDDSLDLGVHAEPNLNTN